MQVCDRHTDRRAKYTICFGVSETVDLCHDCAEEVKKWVAAPEKVLYPITEVETEPKKGADNENGKRKKETLQVKRRKRA